MRRLSDERGEIASWLILAAGLCAAAVVAAGILSVTINRLATDVGNGGDGSVGSPSGLVAAGAPGTPRSGAPGGAPPGTASTPGNVVAAPFDPVPASNYSPDRPGYHQYTTGATLICPRALQCSREEMIDQLSRFAFPGQDPSVPVNDQDVNTVSDVRPGILSRIAPGGDVVTHVSPDGLTIVNQTLPGHVFHDGTITRRLSQVDGNWYLTTTGVGNNGGYFVLPANAMARINESEGTDLFNYVNQQMIRNIEAHHGVAPPR